MIIDILAASVLFIACSVLKKQEECIHEIGNFIIERAEPLKTVCIRSFLQIVCAKWVRVPLDHIPVSEDLQL